MKKLFLWLSILIIIFVVGEKTHLFTSLNLSKVSTPQIFAPQEKQVVVYEESVITKVVDEALPSVVTVGISMTTSTGYIFDLNPLNPFAPFNQSPQTKKKINQNIASGFVISPDGLIITNKHVVSDTNAKYTVLTNDNKKYDVEKIYRDPLNDLAILKIRATNLKPLKLGNSSHLKLGQLAIAIGTPLGEFTNTVTKGIISGLGRGITAGSPFEGYVEKLDNVIQTDAAINPGNSGGPLLNSKGEVIGINAAIAQEGENIGFAIPVNVIKTLIEDFKKQGSNFDRPFIGVRYKMIDKQTAILNDLTEGAYVVEVIPNSPAEKAQIQEEDIIIQFDGQKIKGDSDQQLAQMTLSKKIGDKISVKIWRDGQVLDKQLTLESSNQ